MDMIDISPDKFRKAILFLANPRNVSVQFFDKIGFLKIRPTMLRRKNQVEVNLSKRLRHLFIH